MSLSSNNLLLITRLLNTLVGWSGAVRRAWRDGTEMALKTVAFQTLDRLTGIVTGMAALIMVDSYYGLSGLGMFAWFISLYSITGFFSRYGTALAVENQMAGSAEQDPNLPPQALAALIAIGMVAICVCCMAAIGLPGPAYDSTGAFLYLALGPTLLAGNINALRLAMLNGSGRHRAAAILSILQRIAGLLALLFMCIARLPVPLLTLFVLTGHIVVLVRGRKTQRLPSLAAAFSQRRHVRKTMELGRAFLFSGVFLNVVVYLDMLVLGWFVGPTELGVYARMLILARLFLVIPIGWQPIFRRQANRLTSLGKSSALRSLAARAMRLIFAGHGLAALFLLLYFPSFALDFFSNALGMAHVLRLFALILPGLVFFSAATVLERMFEASRNTALQERIVIEVAVISLVLNLNLIPFAGSNGAALATSISMFLYFLLLGRRLPGDLAQAAIRWPGAVAALYLAFVLLNHAAISFKAALFLVPVTFGGLLWLAGFFETKGSRALTLQQ